MGRYGPGVARRKLAAVADLRMQGWTMKDIATELALSKRTVFNYIQQIKDEIGESAPMQRLKQEAVPLAVENLLEGLADGDKEYTLETLKGTGMLVAHNKHDGGLTNGAPINFAFQVVVEQPPADRAQTSDAMIGNVAGIPRTLATKEEDVIDAESVSSAT